MTALTEGIKLLTIDFKEILKQITNGRELEEVSGDGR